MLGLLKNALATVFLFLFLMTASLWVRSYWVCELWLHSQSTRSDLSFTRDSFGLASGRGGGRRKGTPNTSTLASTRHAADWSIQNQYQSQHHRPANRLLC